MADQVLRQDTDHLRRVESGKQRIAFLWHASRAIASEPLDVAAICRNLAEYLSRDIADCCLIDLIGDDQMVHRVAMAHDGRILDDEPPAPYRLDLRIGLGLHKVAHTGRAEMSRDASPEALAVLLGGSSGHVWQQALDFRGYAVVPLASGDRILGSITLMSCRSDREVGPVELAMVQEVAGRATLAIENARLHQETRQARAEADRQAARFAFLARAGDFLAESLDYHATLSSVARLMVPALADCCLVHVVEPNGEIARVETAHRDSEIEALIRSVQRRAPVLDNPVRQCIQTGKAVLLEDVPMDVLRDRLGHQPGYPELFDAFGPSSLIVVPMLVHGRVLGAITLITGSRERRFGADDLALAEEVAQRAAFAVDNARLYQEAKRAALIQQNLLTLASHDLKNPLNVVLLGASYLNATLPVGQEAEEWVKAAGNIHQAAEKMAKLIHQLLDLVALEKGELKLERQKQDIRPLFDDVLQHWKQRAAEKLQQWRVDLDLDGALLEVDAVRLGQVLQTLVGHAVNETPEGGTIGVLAKRGGGWVEIQVVDQGPGLDLDKLSGLFDPYQAAASKSGRDFAMPIAQGILKAHGGELGVVSRLGEGSCFFLTLPYTDD